MEDFIQASLMLNPPGQPYVFFFFQAEDGIRDYGQGIHQPARGAGAPRRTGGTPLFECAGCSDFGNLIVTNRTHILLWTDSSAAYLDAIKAAGLADRVVADTLPRKEKPSAEQ